MAQRRDGKIVASTICPLTTCMKLVGGAWTPDIIWQLSKGSRRFSELKMEIHGVSSKVLTQRLRRLESYGIVSRQVLSSSPPSVEYSLTQLGSELKPAVESLVRVGEKLKQINQL